ncbi:hypothetical protein CSUI_009054 [Cystoisospora suis]|uniref:Uncharacterized protein n=1 Tax=Cystoisospora suis TaxID=483139 RepID=A0A2C6KJ32_9APIC|nr:hypothetical protein CSUI_009054 [Cystoisospora suis]
MRRYSLQAQRPGICQPWRYTRLTPRGRPSTRRAITEIFSLSLENGPVYHVSQTPSVVDSALSPVQHLHSPHPSPCVDDAWKHLRCLEAVRLASCGAL